MVTNVSMGNIGGVSGSQNIYGSGLSVVQQIQIMLVEDYDNQLKGLAGQIKGTTDIKKAYREEIQHLNKLKSFKVVKDGDKEYYEINSDDLKKLGFDSSSKQSLGDEFFQDKYFTTDSEGEVMTGIVEGSNPFDTYEDKGIKIKEFDKNDGSPQTIRISKDLVDAKVENYNSKLENHNEQSELMSLTLQSVTNQRKIAFEAVSNILKKQNDGQSSVVQNMR